MINWLISLFQKKEEEASTATTTRTYDLEPIVLSNQAAIMFADRYVRRPEVWLLSRADALEFVAACRHFNVKIDGIDGYRITSTSVHLQENTSLDLYNDEEEEHSHRYTAAMEFIAGMEIDMYFEVDCELLDDEDEEDEATWADEEGK